jgi:hypothetical protein
MWFAGIIKGKIERLPTWDLIANILALKNGLHITIAIALAAEALLYKSKWRRQVLLSCLFPINDKCSTLKYDKTFTHGLTVYLI